MNDNFELNVTLDDHFKNQSKPYGGKRVDPIPPSMKEHYFQGLKMPNLSEDYDAIGFNVDHCLATYNIKEMARTIIRHDLEYLHQVCGWPKEIMEFDLGDQSTDLQICMQNCCFDVATGLLLRLGEN